MPPSLGLDHVVLRVHDLDAMLELFHRRLGLPMTWPVRHEAFADYAWVNAGNVQLELWRARSNDDLPVGTRLPCVAGIGLWPHDVHISRQALLDVGVSCKYARAWRTPGADGKVALNFTNVLIHDASGPTCQVFFCEWGPQAPIVPWTKGQSTAQRRQGHVATLAECGGGAIGLIGLQAVHIQSPDPAATARVWLAITGSANCAAPGVELSLAYGSGLCVTTLTFRVIDIGRAQEALKSLGISTAYQGNELWIDPGATSGLRLGLVNI